MHNDTKMFGGSPFFFQAEDGIRDVERSRGLGDVYKRQELVYQCKSELDKNHNIRDNAFDTTGEGRIYETKTATCPVTSFLKYTSLSLYIND